MRNLVFLAATFFPLVFSSIVFAQDDNALPNPVEKTAELVSSTGSALQPLMDQAMQFLPKLGAALGVLIVGWIVAMIVGWIVRSVIRKTPLNSALAKYLPDGGKGSPDAGAPAGKIAFYIVMLFALIGFFQALQLDMISKPLNSFLDQIFNYAPRFLGAGILGVVAWVVARVVKAVSFQGLSAANLDSRFAAATRVDDTNWDAAYQVALEKNPDVQAAVEAGKITKAKVIAGMKERRAARLAETVDPEAGTISTTISETAYWLIFLLFLPAILGVLDMPGILEPIQSMITKGMNYLPNLIAAAVIFGVGWFVAKIVKQIVVNLLAASGADKWTHKAGLNLGTGVSELVGTIVHALILLPVLVAALNALKIDAVTQPASMMLNRITGAIPGIFGGVVVVGIAVFVGQIVSNLVTNVLQGAGADQIPAKLGLAKFDESEGKSLSGLVGKLVLVATVLFSALQALPMMGLSALGDQLDEFMGLAGNVVLAVVLFGAGLYIANLAAETIKGLGVNNAGLLANVARWAIIVLVGTMAIGRSGLAPESVVNLAFGLVLGAIALASAIAFGWGGRDVAKRFLEENVG